MLIVIKENLSTSSEIMEFFPDGSFSLSLYWIVDWFELLRWLIYICEKHIA